MTDTRGIHVFDLEAIPWEPPAARPGRDTRSHGPGVEEKWLVKPKQDDPSEDRFPVSIIRFPPRFLFPRHWHTDGEFVHVLRGSMMVGGAELAVGGLGYNDAKTMYGAEAAGDDGVDFLMIRRAWAKNNLILDDEAVADAVSHGITDSQDRVAAITERGLHVFTPDQTAWTDFAGGSGAKARRKTLMTPSDGAYATDRFPVTIIDLPPASELPDHANSEGLFFLVLEGELVLGGQPVRAGAMAYIDAEVVHPVATGPDGATFVLISRAEGQTVYPNQTEATTAAR